MADVTTIPTIGPQLAQRLRDIGIERVEDLRGQDPEELNACDVLVHGGADRCCLYAYSEAVYFAEAERPDPAKLKWWLWKD